MFEKLILNDPEAQGRLLKSYEMMLDFYGIVLVNQDTGELTRADHWQQRYDNMNRSNRFFTYSQTFKAHFHLVKKEVLLENFTNNKTG